MKKLLTIIALLAAITAQAQSPRYYKLKTPVIALGDTGRYIDWHAVQYPASNVFNWAVITDTINHYVIKRGGVEVPQQVIDSWGTDDKVIPQWMETQKIWLKKPD